MSLYEYLKDFFKTATESEKQELIDFLASLPSNKQ